MQNELIEIRENDSARLEASGLILSVRHAFGRECEAIVGYPGLPNEQRSLFTGDAVLYETPSSGIFEVRVFSQNSVSATFLISHISPRPGFAGAFVTTDPHNSFFEVGELERISASLEVVKESLKLQTDLLPEQIDLISRKLDEIREASTRLGRKDWINYVAGAITSVCASAAFAPDTTGKIFTSINAAFSWLFSNAPYLLR